VKLPSPTEELAGVVWLPRILAKARQLQGGVLQEDYAASFCNPKGVDGVFLAHFGLSREAILSVSHDYRAKSALESHSTESWAARLPNGGAFSCGPGYDLQER